MKFKILTICMVLSLMPAGANANEEAQKQIKAYSEALAAKDEVATNEAWLKISQSPDTIEYMRRYEPRKYKSYKFWGIKGDLGKLRKRHFTALTPISKPSRSLVSTRDDVTNARTAQRFSNQERRTNGDVVRAFSHQRQRTNSDIARSNPNQSRISNQQRIRNRLRRRR